MPGLTPFGIAVRKLRLDKHLRLLDVAKLLDCSAAFLSAIETGRKSIPDGFVLAVARAMKLSTEELARLRKAADRTRKHVSIEKLPENQREIVAAFARRLDKVPPEMMAELKKIVLKSADNEQPFHRTRRGIVVPPVSTQNLRRFAEQVRSAFAEDDLIEFPIMDVLEFRLGAVFEGFYIDIREKESMGEDEGRVIGGTKGLALREDVYEGAWSGNGRDRFTACHEFGHFLMHRTVTMARTREDTDKIFCDAEWQADTFAGTLLMSPRHLGKFRDPDDAARQCGMTGAAAKVMWAKYLVEDCFPRAAEMPRFAWSEWRCRWSMSERVAQTVQAEEVGGDVRSVLVTPAGRRRPKPATRCARSSIILATNALCLCTNENV